MDYHELQKMTVKELRERAKEFPEVTGTSAMHKEQLVDLLCEKLGLQKPHRIVLAANKTEIKSRIHALKKERDEAIAGRDRKKLAAIRHRLHRLRRELHKAAKVTV